MSRNRPGFLRAHKRSPLRDLGITNPGGTSQPKSPPHYPRRNWLCSAPRVRHRPASLDGPPRIGFVWHEVSATASWPLAGNRQIGLILPRTLVFGPKSGEIGFVWRQRFPAARRQGPRLGSFGMSGSVSGPGFLPGSPAGEEAQFDVNGLQFAISSLASVSLPYMFFMHHTLLLPGRQGKKPVPWSLGVCADFRAMSVWATHGGARP
jgi:hypothetical protein